MPNTMKARIVLSMEIDLDAWMETYYEDGEAARTNAPDYLATLVLDAVENLSHIRDESLARVTEATVTARGTRTLVTRPETG